MDLKLVANLWSLLQPMADLKGRNGNIGVTWLTLNKKGAVAPIEIILENIYTTTLTIFPFTNIIFLGDLLSRYFCRSSFSRMICSTSA